MKCRYEFILRGETLATMIGDLHDVERVEDEIVEKYNINPEKDLLVAWRGYVDDRGRYICLPCRTNELKKQEEIALGVCEACLGRMQKVD